MSCWTTLLNATLSPSKSICRPVRIIGAMPLGNQTRNDRQTSGMRSAAGSADKNQARLTRRGSFHA